MVFSCPSEIRRIYFVISGEDFASLMSSVERRNQSSVFVCRAFRK